MENKYRLAALSIYVHLSIPPSSFSPSFDQPFLLQSPLNTHSIAFFALIPPCQRHRLLQRTGSCLVCRTRKPLVVIQQPNNHCSVWLLTCAWAHTQTRMHGQTRTLSLSLKRIHRQIQTAVFFLLMLMKVIKVDKGLCNAERAGVRERQRKRGSEGSSPLTVHSSLPAVLQARGKGERDEERR